jgi:hypothetical protein
MTPSPIRLLAVTLLGVCLGLATVLLLPFLFLVWYDAWWLPHEVEAHLSAAMPSPAEAVQCDGGMEGDNIPESILPESIKPALDEAPLPPAFQRWMDGRQNK